ncbi:hypothetical protein QJQ45_004603 [Haematococcus lacustris]|nr:hypothetical protein QJQ45_004603 [Haematococcus lacustris]
MAEAENRKFTYEVIFRSVHKLLLDTASSEFFFCLDFFEEEGVFKELFAAMIQVVEADLAAAVQDNWDMLSLLLMIRVNHEHRKAMQQQRIPLLEDYLDRVHLLLWPRLKLLFDNQLHSVRSGQERILFNDSPAPHPAVKRYAALAASMLLLMAEYDTDTPGMFKAQTFYDMMERLWSSMFDLLLRMSNMFRDKRSGIVFLIANYNHILTVLRQADAQGLGTAPTQATSTSSSGRPGQGAAATTSTPAVQGIGKTGAGAMREVEDQLASCTNLYVEEQLTSHFGQLVEFVKKAEQQQKRLAVPDGQPVPSYGPPQAAPLLADFSRRWQQAVEAMHQEVLRNVAGGTCGRDVLQASMTALLKYYTRMLELLKKQGPEGQACVKDAVNIPAIMYEIKRITKA